MTTRTTLFDAVDETAPFLAGNGEALDIQAFLRRVAGVMVHLAGANTPVVNLCEQRSAFLVAYVAALLLRRTTLLPASRAPEVVSAVTDENPGCQVIADEDVMAWQSASSAIPDAKLLEIEAAHLAMIGHTSGSTGVPSRHAKWWGVVAASTVHNAAALRAAIPAELAARRPWLVGTVPPQHMYGMELTVLLPLLADMGLHAGRPLLPGEVAAALAEVPEPRILVSTPAHLRAIVASGITLPRVAAIACATAPLDEALARLVEEMTGGQLVEMFGSTETCILAHRRTALERWWTTYPGVKFTPDGAGTIVEAPWFPRPERLQDLVEVDEAGRFVLLGRSADLVDVAGKRASLGDLTQRLLRIPGVVDGVVFQPEHQRGLVRRLAALVVAPGMTSAQIREALLPAMDPVFLPRPLLVVDALPRSAAGKLPRSLLEREFRRLVAGDAAADQAVGDVG